MIKESLSVSPLEKGKEIGKQRRQRYFIRVYYPFRNSNFSLCVPKFNIETVELVDILVPGR